MIIEKSIISKHKHDDGWEYRVSGNEDNKDIELSYYDGYAGEVTNTIKFYGEESIAILEGALALAKRYYGSKTIS